MKPTFYSQAGQDEWICDLFKNKRNGYFVDIGAYDGIKFSNTYYLEKELGWTGLCVDANYDNIYKLKDNRRSAIHNAISDYSGFCKFSGNDMYGSISYEGKEMFCLTLYDLLVHYNAPKQIDYLSIDIEGAELKALSTLFTLNHYQVSAITVEHNAYKVGMEYKNNIQRFLELQGFKLEKEVSADGLYFEDWYVNIKG